jgi:hypothetical protein
MCVQRTIIGPLASRRFHTGPISFFTFDAVAAAFNFLPSLRPSPTALLCQCQRRGTALNYFRQAFPVITITGPPIVRPGLNFRLPVNLNLATVTQPTWLIPGHRNQKLF